MRFVARNALWIAGAMAVPVAAGVAFGRLGALIGVMIALLATLWLWLWLPRAAHGAFEAGKYARAARRYRVLSVLGGSAARERSALLSRAGCFVAAGELAI